MNTAAKVAIGLFVVGGVTLLVVAGSKDAKAAEGGAPPPNPNPQPNILPSLPVPLPSQFPSVQPGPNGGVVVVPPANQAPPGDQPHPFDLPTITPAPAPQGGGLPTQTPAVSIPLPGGGSLNIPPVGLPSIATPVAPTPAASPTSPPVTPPLVLPGQSLPDVPEPHLAAAPTAPADTVAVVKQMLAEEGNGTRWRVSPEPLLKVWQSSRGLSSDGDFGTGTALKMAQEIGTLPIIRGWPKGSTKQGHWLPDYQAALLSLAASAPEPRATHLRAAAQREQGQGFGTPPGLILTQIQFDPND